MTKITIVNEKDEVIGSVERSEAKQDDIYRVSALWIENSQGEVLLAQRSFSKSHDPGRWGPAVAGTVDVEENYDENIKKETEEEIGLSDIQFKKIQKVRISGKHNFFCQWYETVLDKNVDDFTFNKQEVESIRWVSCEELKKEMEAKPENFINSFGDFVPGKFEC